MVATKILSATPLIEGAVIWPARFSTLLLKVKVFSSWVQRRPAVTLSRSVTLQVASPKTA